MMEADPNGRFEFGRNWRRFLRILGDERITIAETSLRNSLAVDDLNGKKFLDIGCGSGLFSLAARRLGASVHSFDYDHHSVNCALELKRRFFPNDDGWFIEQGSVLDKEYIQRLGMHDIVYSWGVLHHTGDMWNAITNASIPVNRGGCLFISIYNYQPYFSRLNKVMKRTYVRSSLPVKGTLLVTYGFLKVMKNLIHDVVFLKNPARRYIEKKKERGMSPIYDWIDWVGGYPFEVAKPDEVFDYVKALGFELVHLKAESWGHGCNEYIFVRK